ncbi:MAG TPA: MFS transporter [Candidatus Koribacter sp.]|jgi:multidrug resistance protein
MPSRSSAAAYLALLLLTLLNFLNYIDRSILFAVQPQIQAEFHCSDSQIGLLTSAFFFCYMIFAPFAGFLADRAARKYIMAVGAVIWSLATLLTAVTHSYSVLLIRHTVVGIGEATFVTITPAFVSDLFPEHVRGRIMAIFYVAIPVGTAIGYLLGGALGHTYGWRMPFYVCAVPGVILGLLLLVVREPQRGVQDTIQQTYERSSLRGLLGNGAFWTCSLGMAMMTFTVGGLQVWMPTFLSRLRGMPLEQANFRFGLLTVIAGTAAALAGGWLGDRLLRRNVGAYYLVSAVGMVLSIPFVIIAIVMHGAIMYPAILLGEFFILLNTAPLNAALVNSVSANIRSTAVAVNLFTIHLLGDAFSPTIIGAISDRTNLEVGFIPTIVAVILSAVILFIGVRTAPKIVAVSSRG